MEIAFASVESAFDFSSSGPSLPGEAGRLLRVVIPLPRENPSALDPDAPRPRRDVGRLGSLIPVLESRPKSFETPGSVEC